MKIKEMMTGAIAALGTTLMSFNASAVLIAVETTDYSNGLAAADNVGALMLGANTISGSLDGECIMRSRIECNLAPNALGVSPTGDGQDSFAYELPSGLEITDVTLLISELSGPADFRVAVNALSAPSLGFDGELGIGVESYSAEGLFTQVSDGNILGNLFAYTIIAGSASELGAFSFSYLVEITTAALPISEVPIPGALVLMLSGLAGLGFAGRKIKRQA